MASTSEATFGNRLEKGRNLAEFVKKLKSWAPSNPLIEIKPFQDFLKSVDQANTQATNRLVHLKDLRARRYESYYGKTGLVKIMPMIRDYVGTLPEGKKSSYYKSIAKECQKLSTRKASKKEVTPSEKGTQTEKKAISRTESSFGSILASGKTVLEIISQISGYKPPFAGAGVAEFTALINAVETLNNDIAGILTETTDVLKTRKELYDGDEGLKKRAQIIKEFVRSAYGRSSNEYKQVVKFKI